MKQLRHDLAAALGRLETADRLAARQSQADVGATISTTAESARGDAASVAAASFKRVQQALRGLEEYAKLIDPQMAAAMELLRYRAYTLERAAGITADSLARLDGARLYVLIDGGANADELAAIANALVAAGTHVLQLRDKQLDDRQLLVRARRLREITAGTATLFVMNDRPDLAVLSHADGVHVGQDELSVKDARRIVGPQAIIGVSTHCIAQARQAVLDGANYIGVGPTFSSQTKSFDKFPGLELLRTVAAEIRLPAFAIGGITRENLAEVLETGVQRVAVSSALVSAVDPATAVREFVEAINAKC